MRPRPYAEAEAELLSAMLYYEDCQAGLGQDFYQRVSITIADIAQDPLRHPIYEGKVSTRNFRRPPRTAIPLYYRLRG